MPEENSKLHFKSLNKLNQLPIRIYCDFESYKDTSKSHTSKNGNTNFDDAHKPASFMLVVVSDVPLPMVHKKINNRYIYNSLYIGEDAGDEYVRQIKELEVILVEHLKTIRETYRPFSNMIITEKQKEEHKNISHCWICKNKFKGDKVKHHNHFTGLYHSSICSKCNLQIKDDIKIPVFFHNLNYDKNLFFKSLYKYGHTNEINILPDNEEQYKCFNIGRLFFLDTFKFLTASLETLIGNIPNDKKTYLKHLSGDNDEKFEYINKKGNFPYEWFDDLKKLDLDITEIKREYFNNKL